MKRKNATNYATHYSITQGTYDRNCSELLRTDNADNVDLDYNGGCGLDEDSADYASVKAVTVT